VKLIVLNRILRNLATVSPRFATLKVRNISHDIVNVDTLYRVKSRGLVKTNAHLIKTDVNLR